MSKSADYPGLITAELKVTVDYTKSLAEMVIAGHYVYQDHNITARKFRIQGEGTVETEVVLVHFDRAFEGRAVIEELEEMGLYPARTEHLPVLKLQQMGLQPAKIEHLLALGAKHPDLQLEFPIICLGSCCLNGACEPSGPFLWRERHERILDLKWFWRGFSSLCRFAAVRKE